VFVSVKRFRSVVSFFIWRLGINVSLTLLSLFSVCLPRCVSLFHVFSQLHWPPVMLCDVITSLNRCIIIIIIIIIPGQCLWCCHHAVAALREFTLVHTVSAARHQVAADLWTKLIGLNHKPTCGLPVNYTHHRHFIIAQPESWYSFYHPTEGRRLSRPSWLATYRDVLPARTRSPIQVLTGPGVE